MSGRRRATEERRLVTWLRINSFLAGIVVAFYLTASLDLFFDHFEARAVVWLPAGYIASAIAGYFVMEGYRALERRWSVARVWMGALLFLCASVGLIGTLALRPVMGRMAPVAAGVLAFTAYAWFRVFFSVRQVVFWSLANSLLDLRQGKRLFGLITTGEAAGALLGFFLIPVLLETGLVSSGGLMLICAALLLGWFMLLSSTVRAFGHRLGEQTEAPVEDLAEPDEAVGFFDNRFMMLFGALAVFPAFALYVDYIFLNTARIQVPAISGLDFGSFIAGFYFLARVTELVFKTKVSGVLLNKWGLRTGLALLPVALLASTAAATLVGILLVLGGDAARFGGAGFVLLFVFLCLDRLSDRVLRPSVNDPSFQVLFQALPASQRLAFQPRIEGRARPFGTALVGVLLIVFGLLMPPDAFSRAGPMVVALVILLAGLAAWATAAVMMGGAYRNELGKILAEIAKRSEPEEESLRMADTLAAVEERLWYAPERKIINALQVLKAVEPALATGLLIDLLHHESPSVRREALVEIGELKVAGALDAVERVFDNEAVGEVLETAEAVRALLRDANDDLSNPETITRLAASSEPADRVYAARLLAQPGACEAPEVVERLLRDPDPTVLRTALSAAWRPAYEASWPRVVAALATPGAFHAAAACLIQAGPATLPALEAYARRVISRPVVLQRVLRIYERVDHPRTLELIWDHVTHPSALVREQVFRSLSLRHAAPSPEQETLLREKLDATLDQAAWNAAAVADLDKCPEAVGVQRSLEREFEERRDRLLRLLEILYDESAIRLVRERLREGKADERVFALELLDMFLDAETKAHVLELMDEHPSGQRLKRLEARKPQDHLGAEERLKDIIARGPSASDRWTRANALRTLATLNPTKRHPEIWANLFNDDPILGQTAAYSLRAANAEAYDAYVAGLPREVRERLAKVLRGGGKKVAGPNERLLMDRVAVLKRIEALGDLSETQLLPFVPALRPVSFNADRQVAREGDSATEVYILAEGGVDITRDSETLLRLETPDVIGELDVLLDRPRSVSLRTTEPTLLFQIDGRVYLDLITTHVPAAGSLIAVFDEL